MPLPISVRAALVLVGFAWQSAGSQLLMPPKIFVVPVSVTNGRPVFGTPQAVADESDANYGEPSFTPDGRSLLFTAGVGQTWPMVRAVYRYDLASRTTTRLTPTAELLDAPNYDFNPATIPSRSRYSVIRFKRAPVRIGERRNPPKATQHLWSFALDGSDPKELFPSVTPLGYMWLDSVTVAMVVAGSPNRLVRGDVVTGAISAPIDVNVDRWLSRLPNASGMSFLTHIDSTNVLSTMRWPGGTVRQSVTLPRGSGNALWISPDVVVATSRARMMAWRTGTTGWTEVADFREFGLAGLYSLALSPDGKSLAIVAQPYSCPAAGEPIFESLARTPNGFEAVPKYHMPQNCLFPAKK